jgi:hypothetical protein
VNYQSKIEQAVRHHATVSDLRAILQAEKAAELARENELSHANAMDVQAMDSAFTSLVDRSDRDPLARRLTLAHEMERLESMHEALGRFLRGIQS